MTSTPNDPTPNLTQDQQAILDRFVEDVADDRHMRTPGERAARAMLDIAAMVKYEDKADRSDLLTLLPRAIRLIGRVSMDGPARDESAWRRRGAVSRATRLLDRIADAIEQGHGWAAVSEVRDLIDDVVIDLIAA